MPTEDAYSSGHLVLSHFWTCKCSNVDTNISWTCLVSGRLSLRVEHPSVLLFLLSSIVWFHMTQLLSSNFHSPKTSIIDINLNVYINFKTNGLGDAKLLFPILVRNCKISIKKLSVAEYMCLQYRWNENVRCVFLLWHTDLHYLSRIRESFKKFCYERLPMAIRKNEVCFTNFVYIFCILSYTNLL